MKNLSILKYIGIVSLFIYGFVFNANSENLTVLNVKANYSANTVSSGNWSNASVWDRSSAPDPTTDKCNLTISHDIVYTPGSDPWSWGNNNEISIVSGASLIVNADLIIDPNFRINIEEGGKLIVYGDLNFENNVRGTIDGEVYVTGDLTVDGGNSSGINGTGSVIVDGDISDDNDAIDFSLIGGIDRWLIVDKGNWNDNSSWSYKQNGPPCVTAPNDQCIVYIPCNYTGIVNINTTIYGLDMKEDAKLEVNPLKTLSVLNEIISDGEIRIKSDISGTGGLIFNGTDPVQANCERYVPSYQYSYVSTPMWDVDASVFNRNTSGYLNPNFYTFDETEPNEDWMYGWKQITSGLLEPGKGYALYSFENFTPVLSGGNLINQEFTMPVTNSVDAGGSKSWNLIGSPFPCHINADDLIDRNDDNGVFTGALYFWEDDLSKDGVYTSEDYMVYTKGGGTSGGNGVINNGIISPMASFFVQADLGGDFIFSENIKSNAFTGPAKSVQNSSENDLKIIHLSVSNDLGLYNDILIKFADDADDYIDIYDGKKLKGNKHIAFYSLIDGEEYAIQGLPGIYDDLTVELGLDANLEATYEIKKEQFKNIDKEQELFLEDKYLNVLTNLSETSYKFSGKGIYKDRFVLHFGNQSKVNVDLQKKFDEGLNKPSVYSDKQTIFVNNIKEKSHLELYDLTGRLLKADKAEIGNNSYNFGLKRGYYIIRISNQTINYSNNIYIQ